jgi:hypothetical protein
MGNNIDGPEITLKASADLSSNQFHIVTLDTDGKVKLADDPDDATEALIGVLQNKPDAEDEEAVVRIDGIAKVMGGASVNEGVWLTCDGNGHAVAAVASDNVIGIAVDAVVSGSVGRVLLKQGAGYVAPA